MKDRPALVALGLGLAAAALAFSMQSGRYGPRIVANPYHAAIQKGDLTTVRRLLDAGAPVDVRTYAGQTGLGLALGFDRWPVAELLLARGADPDAKVYGIPLVRSFALSDDWDAYRWLLRKGARPDPEAAALSQKP